MKTSTLRRIGCGAAILLLVALTAAVIALQRAGSRSSPVLTRALFDEARQRWEQHGPADYDVEVVVRGRQAATYRARVRGGEVIQLTRNGRALTQRRTMGTWSVPGMFDTIAADLRTIDRVTAGTASAGTPQLYLRARFNQRLGYPETYQRIEHRRWGSNPDVSWEVTSFSTRVAD